MSKHKATLTAIEKRILDAARVSGLNQVELSDLSGVDQGTLSRFLTEDPAKRRTITLPVADRLCTALGLKLVQRPRRRRGKSNA